MFVTPGKNKAASAHSISNTSWIQIFISSPVQPIPHLIPSHCDRGLVLCLVEWVLNPAHLPHPVMSHISLFR